MENIDKNYISLQEATNFCDYTQEYLSLRARQGKLKAIKLGRNWATTKKWLDDYLKKTNNYKKLLDQEPVKQEQVAKTIKEADIKEVKTTVKEPEADFEGVTLAELEQLPQRSGKQFRQKLLAGFSKLAKNFSFTFSFLLQPVRRERLLAIAGALVLLLATVGLASSYTYIQPVLEKVEQKLKDNSQQVVQTFNPQAFSQFFVEVSNNLDVFSSKVKQKVLSIVRAIKNNGQQTITVLIKQPTGFIAVFSSRIDSFGNSALLYFKGVFQEIVDLFSKEPIIITKDQFLTKQQTEQLIVEKINEFGISKTGITVYDEQTSRAYCIEVSNGAIKNTAGKCATSSDIEF